MVNIKVGDKVRIIGNTSAHRFKTGDIVENMNGNDLFKGDSGMWYVRPEDYEPISDKTFKVGDICRIVSNKGVTRDKIHHFPIGTMVKVIITPSNSNDSYRVEGLSLDLIQFVKPYHMELVEKVAEPNKTDIKVEQDILGIADYIHIGDITIALPKNCPIGISRKHSDDDNVKEVGQALAFTRLMKSSKDKGLI